MVTATFAYLGTELVGVTVGEAQNPRKTIPRAIRLTFYRILIFYCLSVLLIGMLVPYNSPELAFATKQNSSASASPFVVAIKLSGIQGLDHVLNGAICMFVFSASNSDLYIASRTLYGLSSEGSAPRIFKRTNKSGVPIYSLGLSAIFALLAYMNVADDSKKIFSYFVNLTTIFGLLTWISILVTHIYFIKARRAQNIPDSVMPYVAPLGIWGSYGALAFAVLIALTKNYDVFVGGFKYETFITGYLGIPLYLILIFGHKAWTKSRGVKPHEADFYAGKDLIDREEEEFLAAKAALKERRKAEMKGQKKGLGWFYKKFVSWLF